MKTKMTVLLYAIITFIACSKDDRPAPKANSEETPLTPFLQKSGLDESIDNYPKGSYNEYGFKFKPKIKGTISAVSLKVPVTFANRHFLNMLQQHVYFVERSVLSFNKRNNR